MTYFFMTVVFLSLYLFIMYSDYKLKRFTMEHRKRGFRKKVRAGAIHYYRIYKNIYMQISIGISPYEMMKRLYLVTDHRDLKNLLMEMSVIVTNSNDVEKGIHFLKKYLVDEDSRLFINILQSSVKTGFSLNSMKQLDHFFFQKYLISIRNRVKQMKRRYFLSSFLFCSAIFIAIFMPIVNEMLTSLQSIFNSY